jgi:hypothetical protein
MTYPIKTFKAPATKIDDSVQVIEGQGSVPLKKIEDISVPGAPSKADMKAKGFGAMLRSQMFKVR